MELSHLDEFVTLVNEGSFVAAARVLRLGQPTLSKHMAALERELGASLLARGKGGVEPTEAGRVLYGQALRMGAMWARTRRAVAEVREDCAPARYGAKPEDALEIHCRSLARAAALPEHMAGALEAFARGSSLADIEADLGVSRDEAAEALGCAFRVLHARSRSDMLNKLYSISE